MNKDGLKAVIFDLDGTLAESKMPLNREMADALRKLLNHYLVAVISGASFGQFQNQFLLNVRPESNLENLYLLPTSGAELRTHRRNEWNTVYKISLDHNEKEKIIDALNKMISEFKVDNEQLFGKRIEDRESQITFSALGQEAPIEEKNKWDADHAKRTKMKEFLLKLIPEFNINIGGSTSIDITRNGFDKSMGIKELSKYTGIKIQEMVYVGDALFPGGNDSVVINTGIKTKQVNSVMDTLNFIKELINNA